ncbi:hypothetical protein PHLCEN_2v3922 [Hermanssonia centrifuga]|uniref:Uncharacterized protein n=1 Tax=Hermanssonia centrifuga TaxID=98765 RepID=A0A2R6QB64_9APHY|nr:hypothetical protein PHLCEN_2v3922 [Hermanssonia centrifuga]
MCQGELRKRRVCTGPNKSANSLQASGKANAAAIKAYAKCHGIQRGGTKKEDGRPTGDQPPLNLEAKDEGLLTFVQSISCRRAIWAEAFDNQPPDPCTWAL